MLEMYSSCRMQQSAKAAIVEMVASNLEMGVSSACRRPTPRDLFHALEKSVREQLPSNPDSIHGLPWILGRTSWTTRDMSALCPPFIDVSTASLRRGIKHGALFKQ